VYTWGPLEKIASIWGRVLGKNRDILFFGALVLSSFVAFLPFARETSMSNFFVYALLLIVYVFANGTKFKKVESPSGLFMVLALAAIAGSFVFNTIVSRYQTRPYYGLTDYVILAVGIYALFYTIEDKLVRFGIYVLAFVRAGTLVLATFSLSLFVSVSNFFVALVVFFSKIFVSPAIHSGAVNPGEVVAVGDAGTTSVFIGWACAGLEELVLTTVLIFVLIRSFDMNRTKTAIWLGIGIMGSFFINIARMVILVWVAADYGVVKMLWVHTHLGDVLFLVWIGIFWALFFKFALPPSKSKKERVAVS